MFKVGDIFRVIESSNEYLICRLARDKELRITAYVLQHKIVATSKAADPGIFNLNEGSRVEVVSSGNYVSKLECLVYGVPLDE